MKILSSGSRDVPCGQAGGRTGQDRTRRDEASSRFSEFLRTRLEVKLQQTFGTLSLYFNAAFIINFFDPAVTNEFRTVERETSWCMQSKCQL
jgi:hypothetical protein